MKRVNILSAIVATVIGSGFTVTANAAEKLTYYCSAQEDWCQLMADGFEEATGIKVSMTRKSSCLLYTSPSPRDKRQSRMPSSA